MSNQHALEQIQAVPSLGEGLQIHFAFLADTPDFAPALVSIAACASRLPVALPSFPSFLSFPFFS
jgi:hypothetical protein